MPSGTIEMIDTLLKHGATLSFLAFLEAFEREETAVFQKLIDYGWDVDSTEFELPAVQLVLDNERLLRWFLDHGANPNTKSVRRGASCLQPCTPLAAAAEFDDDAPLKLLLAYGAEMDPLALFHAIGVRGQANGMATTIALVEHGADVNYMASLWATPLHHAVNWGAKEKLVYLLENGADPRRGSRSSEDTPAMFAKAKKQPELVKILEEAEARQEN
ncbi:uncharacterized protein J4E92_008819 [Alternaria infectoria]|uniref:uncharacterized protein n=1 Tax=Alternaria infectoria TaxID=45303 RepID=UPI00221FB5D6|nr:uncharacterized protein J4E92_008819 [Alternaria infectoria]KAI4917882.1 hypothetical protein J4E92_008819 [Alternaria infectoria]